MLNFSIKFPIMKKFFLVISFSVREFDPA